MSEQAERAAEITSRWTNRRIDEHRDECSKLRKLAEETPGPSPEHEALLESAVVSRSTADLLHFAIKGYANALNSRPPAAPRREPAKSTYLKGYTRGRAALKKLADPPGTEHSPP